ncbi:ATP-dependent zinc metalloprotease FtsH [Amycolatopsis sp. CB00013]|uniref:ATP-dependent zinc metalloprotease FtsH n=1 Tax=Amycolatopsis sp. CB00013 TaxID=1703945 RepID=UPI000939C4E6
MSRTAEPGPPSDPIPPARPPEPSGRRRWLVPAAFLVMLLLFFLPHLLTAETPTFGYTELLSKVDAGQVEKVTVDDDGAIKGNLRDGTAFTTQLPVALDDDQLLPKLKDKGVQITGAPGGTSGVLSFVGSLLPLLLLVGFLIWMGKGAQRSLAKAGGFGRSKAKIIEAQRPTTRFADVAGYEGVKQDVSEIVGFLRDPDRYAAAGAKGPRGVIMVGPPGTGKTLLARAVAGEASVPFLSVTGSEFVEMFVGVGASRVRDLFTEARNRAPSIIFIDEIDAVGSRRGVGGGTGGHDEREQTLNQLLAEMDGFDQSSGIVVLAATNRPESLDPALLRPGRFDRQVTVPLPNQDERAAILAVHVNGKHLGPDVDLRRIARGTPGFSGADLANLVNEGAINAVRAGRTTITAADLDSARDRLLLGRRETSNALLPEERHAVAVHESGHALIAALCEHADPVAKVTILPAGMALGATEQLPEAERHLYSEAYLTDLLTIRLGGRAAELVVFRQGSTGAADDLAGATALAVKMVTEFGLSTTLGPVAYPAAHARFLADDPAERRNGGFSERTQQVIDREVTRLLRAAEDRAVGALRGHRKALDLLTAELMSEETVDGSVVLDVLRQETEAGDLAS